jgi:hypothetical protein
VNWWCGSIGAGVRLSREIMKIECATRPLRAGLTCVAPTALGKTNAVGWTPVPRGRIGHPPKGGNKTRRRADPSPPSRNCDFWASRSREAFKSF